MNFDTLLTQMETQRPELSDSLKMLREFNRTRQDSQGTVAVDARTDDQHIRDLEALLEKQRNINKDLLKQYERIKDNYQLLLGHMDEMACATGACPECWGEDSSCAYCRGKGRPGYYLPDQQHFEMYIKPVIQKIKNNQSQGNH
jgi:hypothetical protein